LLALGLHAESSALAQEGTTMRSLAWRWTLAILFGSAWNAIAAFVFAGP
jgi:hypothetical protein